MEKPLYQFLDNKATFAVKEAHLNRALYFPLCNNHPFMSAITPYLQGDIKTDNNSFLLEPATRIGFFTSRLNRNFWCYLGPSKVWSASGMSKEQNILNKDTCQVEAGLLWHRISRQNRKIGLKAEITSFVPAGQAPVEIMLVTLTNISRNKIQITPTAAIPIYGRSANNLRDHRQVTSLLNRIKVIRYGVTVKPTLVFDESGHKKNDTTYFVFGADENGLPPESIFPTIEYFCKDCSDLENPVAVYQNLPHPNLRYVEGKEAIGGLRFKKRKLLPQENASYIVVMGITKNSPPEGIWQGFNSLAKCNRALEKTKEFWLKKSEEINLKSPDKEFNNWFRWVSVQPFLRKIYGCSFLPDFDYGRGGRGWRDLWQDCLSLILTSPEQVRPTLINNFKGVRIDGSNATIIGQRPGEFIADRNNISRVWMDHGVWPFITTLFYLNQTQDFALLWEKATYFCDQHLCRSRIINPNWKQKDNILRDKSGRTYEGTLLEHILIQNLTQFFNVGPHNHIRLEGADWNDGLDMAKEFGESVAFTAMYAKNLSDIANLLRQLKINKIEVCQELKILLDSIGKNPISYNSVSQKLNLLETYFKAVNWGITGKKINISLASLIEDLEKKSSWIKRHIQKSEWLKEGFFNGYYDNEKKRVEGKFGKTMRMTLTSATFAIMSGVATDSQIASIWKMANRYLRDKKLKGFHLNTNFGAEQHSLGRAFSFSYGDKENGAFFNHMAVMFAYALYSRGFVKEGFEALNSIYKMAQDSATSKIYPCLPEYFNSEGQGMYCYLTGSASWFVLTLLTQACGIRGEYGNLIIEPKLSSQQFQGGKEFSVATNFADKRIEVCFLNPPKKDYPDYTIQSLCLNGQIIEANLKRRRSIIMRSQFLELAKMPVNKILVALD